MDNVNEFPECGPSRGRYLTWARGIVEEAFALDPVFMDEAVRAIFGHPVFAWSYVPLEKIQRLSVAAMTVRLVG